MWASAVGVCGLQDLCLAGSRTRALIAVAHGLSCPEACGIFREQELNSCPLHWHVNSQPMNTKEVLTNAFLIDVSEYVYIPEYRFDHILFMSIQI